MLYQVSSVRGRSHRNAATLWPVWRPLLCQKNVQVLIWHGTSFLCWVFVLLTSWRGRQSCHWNWSSGLTFAFVWRWGGVWVIPGKPWDLCMVHKQWAGVESITGSRNSQMGALNWLISTGIHEATPDAPPRTSRLSKMPFLPTAAPLCRLFTLVLEYLRVPFTEFSRKTWT